jgi:hypothetical protein
LEKFEPTHVGCYEPEPVHGPNAFKKRKRAFHEPSVRSSSSSIRWLGFEDEDEQEDD